MDASRSHGSRWHRRVRRVVATIGGVTSVVALGSTTAGASSRTTMTIATTSSTSGGVLVALGGGVLVLGIIGIVIFTWSRRKRRPDQCAEQREALALAERTVQYWEAARAHLEALKMDVASDGTPHATLVAKAVEGLNSAVRQRDQCQLDLINCMASGGPAIPVNPTLQPWPYLTHGSDGESPAPPGG